MLKLPSAPDITVVVSRLLPPDEPYPVEPATYRPIVEPLIGNCPPCTFPWIAAPVNGEWSTEVRFVIEQPEGNTTAEDTATARTPGRLAFQAKRGIIILFCDSDPDGLKIECFY